MEFLSSEYWWMCLTLVLQHQSRLFWGSSHQISPAKYYHRSSRGLFSVWFLKRVFVASEYNTNTTIQIISGIYNKIFKEGSSLLLHTLHRGRGRRGGRGGGSDRPGQCFGCKRPQSSVPIWQRRIDCQCPYNSRIWSSCHQNPGNCLLPHNLQSNLSSMLWMTSMFKVSSFSSLYQSFTSLRQCRASASSWVVETVNISTG